MDIILFLGWMLLILVPVAIVTSPRIDRDAGCKCTGIICGCEVGRRKLDE